MLGWASRVDAYDIASRVDAQQQKDSRVEARDSRVEALKTWGWETRYIPKN